MSTAPFQAFQDFQRDLARHLRDPHHTRRPAGVPARRAAVYQSLLFNNICTFLDKCFPVCAALLGARRWRRLNRTFYRDWPLHSPLFRDIPRDFVAYLAATPALRLPAWMPELAHYEWAELAVDICEASPGDFNPTGEMLTQRIVPNPALETLACAWPVHRIGPDYRPRKPRATFLAVFRDACDAVRFCELNAVTARLIALLSDTPRSGREALHIISRELQHPDPEQLLTHGRAVLEQLREQGILLGTRT